LAKEAWKASSKREREMRERKKIQSCQNSKIEVTPQGESK
jgi:hypothetical protein